jgi:phage-related protein
VEPNRGRTHLHLGHTLALVTLAVLFWAGTPVSGQGMPSQDNDIRNGQLAIMDRFLDSHPEISEQLAKDPSLIRNEEFVAKHPELQEFLQNHPGVREEFTENPNAFMRQEERFERREEAGNTRFGDGDTTRRELANMDRFLDSHPEIAEQLQKDPSLINNQQFIAKHPELQEFLQSHPGVREEFTENPNAFMRQEERFERREEAGNGRFGDGDTTRRQLATMDRFLDSHPEIAEQLQKDPSLIKNQEFVAKHPELQAFLQKHPGVREEFTEDPAAFMRQEQRFERQEEAGNGRFGDGDTTRRQLATMDRFLDSHPEIAEQLQKDPSLIKNQEFVAKHPELQAFLQKHPGVREEFREDPAAFMRQEQRFERREDFDARGVRDRDTNREEMASFGLFLSGHSGVAQQLSKDPSLVNNKEWLASHPELGAFLKSHPGAKAELMKDPQAFMNSVQQAGNNTATAKPVLQPKHKQ